MTANNHAILADNQRLLITHKPGRSGKAIISFAGVGLKSDGVPQEEFVKSLSGNEDHDQYFVVDKERTWYNATAPEIIDTLRPRLLEHEGAVTLGNSMGGFGAVYFASHLPRCKAALAFVPQYSLNAQITPTETRWRAWRDQITEWKIMHALVNASPQIPMYIFFGEATDSCHLELYQQNLTPKMAIYVLAGQGHRTASYLRDQEMLLPILDAAWSGIEGEDLRRLLNERGIKTVPQPERYGS